MVCSGVILGQVFLDAPRKEGLLSLSLDPAWYNPYPNMGNFYLIAGGEKFREITQIHEFSMWFHGKTTNCVSGHIYAWYIKLNRVYYNTNSRKKK